MRSFYCHLHNSNNCIAATIARALVLPQLFVTHLVGRLEHIALNHLHRRSPAPLPISAQSRMIERSFATLASTARDKQNQKSCVLVVLSVTKAVFSPCLVQVLALTAPSHRNRRRCALPVVSAPNPTIELTYVMRGITAPSQQNSNCRVLPELSARLPILLFPFLALPGSFAMQVVRNRQLVRLATSVQEALRSLYRVPRISTLHQVCFNFCVCGSLSAEKLGCQHCPSISHCCSANSTACLSCPDGSLCQNGILMGPKPPRKKALGPGAIAAIVVASVISSAARAHISSAHCVTCFAVALAIFLYRRYAQSCSVTCPRLSIPKIQLPKYVGQQEDGRKSLLSDDGASHTHPL